MTVLGQVAQAAADVLYEVRRVVGVDAMKKLKSYWTMLFTRTLMTPGFTRVLSSYIGKREFLQQLCRFVNRYPPIYNTHSLYYTNAVKCFMN